MSEQLDRLGRQLDAIAAVRAVAQEEPDEDERKRLMAVIDHAQGSALEDYADTPRRPRFRLLKGGLGAAAVTAIASHAREHPTALAAVTAATVAVAALGAVIALGPSDETPYSAGRPPAATTPAPTTTVSPPRSSTPTTGPGDPGPTTRIPAPPDVGAPSSTAAMLPAASDSAVPTVPPSSSPPTTVPPSSGPTTIPVTPPPSTPPSTPPPRQPPPGSGLCVDVGLPPLLSIDICL